MKKLNILVFNAGLYSSLDGSVVRFKNLLAGKEKEASVVWVDGARQGIYKTEKLDSRVPKNFTVTPAMQPAGHKLLDLTARERHFLHYAREYADWADVAVFYSPWGCALARRLLRKRGVPVVFDYIDLIHAFRSNPLERAVSRTAVVHALKSSDAVIATASALFEDARSYGKSVFLIPNGVNLDRITGSKPVPKRKGLVKSPAVGFVGGFGSWVDFDSVLEAAASLPKVNFYFIGDGVQRKKLESAARERKGKNVFVSPQFVPQPDAFEWMASMDVCLVPFKKNELTDAVCPIKLFEYWALGKPVVSGRTREVQKIAGSAALYASTPAEYAKAVSRLVGNASLRSSLGMLGREKAGKYDWRVLSNSFLSVLRRAAEKRV